MPQCYTNDIFDLQQAGNPLLKKYQIKGGIDKEICSLKQLVKFISSSSNKEKSKKLQAAEMANLQKPLDSVANR